MNRHRQPTIRVRRAITQASNVMIESSLLKTRIRLLQCYDWKPTALCVMYSGTVVAEGLLLAAVSMAMGISFGCTAVLWWLRVYCWLCLWQWGSLLDVQRYRGGRGSIVGCIYGNGDLFWMYTGTVVAEGLLLAVSMAMGISSRCTAVLWWQRVYCWLYLWQWGSILDVQRYRGGRGSIVGCIYDNRDFFLMYSGTVGAEDILLAVSMAMGISYIKTAVLCWQKVYCWLYQWQWAYLLDVQRYRIGRGCIVGCIYDNGDLFWVYKGTVVAEGVFLAVSMAMRISSGCTAVPWWWRVYCWLYLWQWGSLLDVQRYRGGRGSIVGYIYGNGDFFWMYTGTVVAEGVLLAVSMAMRFSSRCTVVPWWRSV